METRERAVRKVANRWPRRPSSVKHRIEDASQVRCPKCSTPLRRQTIQAGQGFAKCQATTGSGGRCGQAFAYFAAQGVVAVETLAEEVFDHLLQHQAMYTSMRASLEAYLRGDVVTPEGERPAAAPARQVSERMLLLLQGLAGGKATAKRWMVEAGLPRATFFRQMRLALSEGAVMRERGGGGRVFYVLTGVGARLVSGITQVSDT